MQCFTVRGQRHNDAKSIPHTIKSLAGTVGSHQLASGKTCRAAGVTPEANCIPMRALTEKITVVASFLPSLPFLRLSFLSWSWRVLSWSLFSRPDFYS
jgi:hypothetical protein